MKTLWGFLRDGGWIGVGWDVDRAERCSRVPASFPKVTDGEGGSHIFYVSPLFRYDGASIPSKPNLRSISRANTLSKTFRDPSSLILFRTSCFVLSKRSWFVANATWVSLFASRTGLYRTHFSSNSCESLLNRMKKDGFLFGNLYLFRRIVLTNIYDERGFTTVESSIVVIILLDANVLCFRIF